MGFVSGSTFVNVADYGALSDGSTNDTTSVQNAANAASGKTLYFPDGTTSISTLTLLPNTERTGLVV
jgi:polygalacturonase